jgi:hypothetical protein
MPRLPGAGPMTMDMIRNEFKRGPSMGAYLNVRHDAGQFPGSNLAFSNFYGRQNVFTVEHYTAGATDWDLYEWTRSLGWDGVVPVVGTYGPAPGAVVQASSIDTFAMRIYGFPAGSSITIHNNGGYIVGHGGAGGGDVGEPYGPEGGRGGGAIIARSSFVLLNGGVIGGGGGGGAALPEFFGIRARGGGGATNGWPNGGLGNGPGESGAAAADRHGGIPGLDAGASRAGNGGLWGESGQGWFDYNGAGPYGAGGPPGVTIDGASYCSATVYGDTRGYNAN